MSNGVILLKGLVSPIILLLEVRNVKTTCRKSWPGNLFQMLNLTFDPASGLNGVLTLKYPYFFLLIGAIASELKTDHEKSWPANVLSEKNFGLILKNKMAAIANNFKIIKML